MMMQTLHCVIFLSSFSVLEFSKMVYHYLPKGGEANGSMRGEGDLKIAVFGVCPF